LYYFHNDHLGTPQRITDQTGTIVWSANYKPFGETNITTNTITNPFRFPGQYYDQETGLHYNYFRYYEPGIGRYLRPDPLLLFPINQSQGRLLLYQEDDLSLYTYNVPIIVSDDRYTYTQNNSVSFMDRYGLMALIASFSIRYNYKGFGQEAALLNVFLGSLNPDQNILSIYNSAETYLAWGRSIGRGWSLGFWSGNYCEYNNAKEYAIYTPYGSFSFLFNYKSKNFGVVIGGSSVGPGGILTKGSLPQILRYENDIKVKIFSDLDPLNRYMLGP